MSNDTFSLLERIMCDIDSTKKNAMNRVEKTFSFSLSYEDAVVTRCFSVGCDHRSFQSNSVPDSLSTVLEMQVSHGSFGCWSAHGGMYLSSVTSWYSDFCCMQQVSLKETLHFLIDFDRKQWRVYIGYHKEKIWILFSFSMTSTKSLFLI